MKKAIHILLLLSIVSCSQSPEKYIDHLSGYWEIDEVILGDGSKRDYNYNEIIDFFSITDSLTGFRKKVKPNFDGTFATSNDAEAFKLIIDNGHLSIYYRTPFAEWKETVLEATEKRMIIENQKKIRYIYKRYEPLELE